MVVTFVPSLVPTMPAISLDELQRRIAQQEQKLQDLRQKLESRQSHLSELTRRKEELQSQLRQVEEEIAALGPATPASAEQPVPPAKESTTTRTEGQPPLRALILTMLGETSEPMTSRQLCEGARQRGYQPTTRDPVASVKARLQELRSEGLVQRAAGQPGYILAPSANGNRKKSKPSPKAASEAAKKKSGKASPARKAKSGGRGGQPPLREVLTGLLKDSRKPLSGSELAEQALAAGYKSKSEKFVDNVWATLAKMENVEHVPDKGYRLKGKA